MTLLELTAAMSLLVLVVAAASKLMMSNLRTLKTTHEVMAQAADLDLMLGRMKRDVWAAEAITVDASAVTLRTGEHAVTWRTRDDGRTSRHAGDDREQVWPAVGATPRFAASPHGLIVGLGGEPGVLMVSQVLQGSAR